MCHMIHEWYAYDPKICGGLTVSAVVTACLLLNVGHEDLVAVPKQDRSHPYRDIAVGKSPEKESRAAHAGNTAAKTDHGAAGLTGKKGDGESQQRGHQQTAAHPVEAAGDKDYREQRQKYWDNAAHRAEQQRNLQYQIFVLFHHALSFALPMAVIQQSGKLHPLF